MLNIKNTIDGFLKDVEIKGNTIQDIHQTGDLADIRSVGDKLENQELYKIPVLCTNGLDSSDSNYKEHKLTILSPTPLEKVGAIADRIICKDGVWGVEKNIGELSLNGSETLKLTSTQPTNTNLINVYANGLPLPNGREVICDKFVFTKDINVEGISIGQSNSNLHISINKDKLTTQDLAGARVWLQENNVLVKHQLTQPQFIPLPNSQQIVLRTFANKTNISFLTEIEGTIKAQVPKSIGATVNSHTEQINNLSKELEKINNLEETVTSEVVSESDFITIENTNSGYFSDIKLEGKTLILNTDNEVVDAGTEGATLKSVGQDVDEISVLSQWANGNLFNGELEHGQYNNSTGGRVDSLYSVRNVNMINVKPGSIITIHNDYSYSNYLYQYDKNKNFLTFNALANTIKLNNDCHYINFRSSVDKKQNDLKVNYVVNYGDAALDVVRKQDKKRILYYNDETQTWEKPVLRQWDSIEKHSDGKYYYHKRSGEVALNGSEDWKDRSNDHISDTQTRFSASFNAKPCSSTDITLICDKYPVLKATGSAASKGENGICLYTKGTSIYITVPKTTLAEFKTTLEANPVTVVYQLAEEKVYECTNLDLITYSGETNLLVKSGVLNPKVTLKVKKGIGNVVTMLQNKVAMLEDLVSKLIQNK